jgi:hypothetical protein
MARNMTFKRVRPSDLDFRSLGTSAPRETEADREAKQKAIDEWLKVNQIKRVEKG